MNAIFSKIVANLPIRFHFVESVAKKDFYLSSLTWSWQSWFTHRFQTGSTDFDCSACKVFSFSAGDLPFGSSAPFWTHGNKLHYKDSSCEQFTQSDHKDSILLSKIKKLGICWHWTSLSFDQLLKVKTKNRFQNERSLLAGNYNSLILDYERACDTFKLFQDQTMAQYFDFRDCDSLQ